MHRALGCKQGYPWSGSFIALPRLKDWLALLGFEVVGGQFAPMRRRSIKPNGWNVARLWKRRVTAGGR